MKKYILSLDQGTTSSRAVLFDENANILSIEQKETKQIYPYAGWVEQDPEEIFKNQLETAEHVLIKANITPEQVSAIGITNQRETTVVWDRKSGKAIYNAIIWQDKRTASYCETIKKDGWSDYISENTGLIIDSYFSASKLHWILNNVKGAKQAAEKGELLFGTIDTYLAWKLSGGNLHITDFSNASRTMLFNIKKLCWDEKLLKLFGIPHEMLPQVIESSKIYGHTSDYFFGGKQIPISGIAGDQQAALFGQGCFEEGMVKNTYGTGCFMLMNTGKTPVKSTNGLITTIAWGISGKIEYALEGSVFVAGAVVKWLRDNLGLISTAAETEAIAYEAGDNHGVYFVPAFAGLGAPYWDMHAKAIITGLTLDVEKKHIIRAALESMAYQTRDVLLAMQQDSGIHLKTLKVDGGASANNFLMQFQADVLGTEVIRPENTESTALGSAFLAGLGIGLWNKNDLNKLNRSDKIFLPKITMNDADILYNEWLKSVEKSKS